MTNEIVLIHCLFPWNIFTFRAGERHTSLRPMLSYPRPAKSVSCGG